MIRFENILVKVAVIILIQQLLAEVKSTYSRWVIRGISGDEIGLRRFFNWNFLSGLSISQLVLVTGIAVFTFATFPLGVWMSSLNAGQSYTARVMVGAVVQFIMLPVAIFNLSRVLNELILTPRTMVGIGLVMFSKIIAVLGAWVMSQGQVVK